MSKVEQVGGTHYSQGANPQHWDLAIMYEWDIFQYQITKYIMRWKYKHATHAQRVEDLRKARSFLDKYIANAGAYDPAPPVDASQLELDFTASVYSDPTAAARMDYWKCGRYVCTGCGTVQVGDTPQDALQRHKTCPVQAGPGYTSQG